MKRLLLPLLAALALPTAIKTESLPTAIKTESVPNAASSESVYLIINIRYHLSNSTSVIPMDTMSQCELAGAKLIASKKLHPLPEVDPYHSIGFECIEGK